MKVRSEPIVVHQVRVRKDGAIELLEPGATSWTPVSRTRLARDYGPEHPVWVELRARGVRRPCPGSSRDRARGFYGLRLDEDEAKRLDELAVRRGLTRRDLIVSLLEAAEGHETTAKTG